MTQLTWQAITAEAIRRKAQALKDGRGDIEIEALIVEITRENWTPPEPEPVDPDILAFREWLMEREPDMREPSYEYDADFWDNCLSAKAYLAGARMARAEKLSLLNWLTDQKSLEVSWGGNPEENGAWSVYRVTGGLNDREWHLIDTGETPLAALKNARALLKEPD